MSSNGSLYGSAESSNGGGSDGGGGGGGGGGGEIMLFGVRVKVDPMRKSVSMNNLSQYELPNGNNAVNDDAVVVAAAAAAVAEDTGYASADDALPHQSTGGRERKRGVPWTEEEHKLFLLGLQKVGKGDWRGISRNFVKTRTPTQVASHAQKYFLRKNNLNRRRRRSSLFDITTDSVTAMPMDESKNPQGTSNPQVVRPTSIPMAKTATFTSNMSTFPVAQFPVTVNPVLFPVQAQNNASTMLLRPVQVVPISNSSSTMVDFNLNQRFAIDQTQLSLGLSLSSGGQSQFSAYQATSSFKNGESYISVA